MELTGPMSVVASNGSPTTNCLVWWRSRSWNWGRIEDSTKMREPQRQICPELRKVILVTALATSSRRSSPPTPWNLSAKTIVAFFPPSSSEALVNLFAAVTATCAPVLVPPVKLMALTVRCDTMGAPTSAPRPCKTFKRPLGAPHWSKRSAIMEAVVGVISEGLATMELPIMRAGAIFQVRRYNGRFHGVIKATTPRGFESV
mmetsp:Transcript_25418/g.30136  ORF Transcript_25418/g.30136 Transcript_25418/m.30136 type:complete len:202 (-) Transcript_25418:479-1084(-)